MICSLNIYIVMQLQIKQASKNQSLSLDYPRHCQNAQHGLNNHEYGWSLYKKNVVNIFNSVKIRSFGKLQSNSDIGMLYTPDALLRLIRYFYTKILRLSACIYDMQAFFSRLPSFLWHSHKSNHFQRTTNLCCIFDFA